jgi:acid phosphatase type 7
MAKSIRTIMRLAPLLALAAFAPPAGAATTCPTGTSSYSTGVAGTPGLVAYWRLDDAGGTQACDGKGAAPGTYSGGYALGRAGAITGDSDTAAGFDGTSGSVSVPDAAALHVGDTFTIEAWVKRGSIGGSANQVIASKQNNSWVLMFNPSNQLVLRQSTVADLAASTATVTDTSTWHHVVATKNGTSVRLYLDGRDVTGTVSNTTMPNNTMPLAIGQSTGTAYFSGTIDEVALYNVALSASQVSSHYSAGSPPPPPPPSTDPVVAAAGDIACDPTDPNYNGGLGNAVGCQMRAVSNLLSSGGLAGILALGDDQYEYGTLSTFGSVFAPTWGRFKTLIHSVTGNHEYYTTGAKGYFDYFDGIGNSTGPAGPRTAGYYSFSVGSWHIVALNSNCGEIGGCGSGSAEDKWLRNDLAAHPAKCTLAYWHHPRFTSGSEGGGNSTFMSQIYSDLYAANADVVLSGHDHDYERFAPQNPSGQLDTTRGMREFVVGTGGKSHHTFAATAANSQVRNNTTFGVLRLTLHPTGYDWQFVPAAGSIFTDSGSTACH